MPPIVQEKYCPLYRLDHLITEKSFKEKRTQQSIRKEIMQLLEISQITLWRARRAQVGGSGSPLSTADLVKLKDYFGCSLDDLVVTDEPSVALSPDHDPGTSAVPSETTGAFLSDNPSIS